METAEYSTGPHTCAEYARMALEGGRKHGEPLHLLGDAVELAVEAIIYDLRDRRALKHSWDQIDEDVQQEIRHVWGIIIESVLDKQPSSVV